MTLHPGSTRTLRLAAMVVLGIGSAGTASAQLPANGQVVLNVEQIAAASEVVPFAVPVALASEERTGEIQSPLWPRLPSHLSNRFPQVSFQLADQPVRAIGINLSLLGITDATVFTKGVSYTRSLSEPLAIEGAIDIGRGSGHEVATAALRAVIRGYDPQRGQVFAAVGLAEAFASGDQRVHPHGLGVAYGIGAQSRWTGNVALRGELQLLTFRHDVNALRLTAGVVVGVD